jgi:hypothetical protein
MGRIARYLAQVRILGLIARNLRQADRLAVADAAAAPPSVPAHRTRETACATHVVGLTANCGSPLLVPKTGASIFTSRSALSSSTGLPESAYADSRPPTCRITVSKNGARFVCGRQIRNRACRARARGYDWM